MARTAMRPWVAAALGTMVGVAGLGAPKANAQCIEAVVYATRENDSRVYVYGEHDPCVTDTPWNQSYTYHGELVQAGLPQGMPNGYWIDLWVPAP